MKIFKLFIVASALFLTHSTFAQSTQEKFKVSGECGMCKSKIEKAAKTAGATFADWNTDTKELTVKYESKSSNAAKIQQSIAGVGYDTPGFKATDEAYNKLHSCCKYERKSVSDYNAKADDCCNGEKCEKCEKCKEGKCDHKACKDGDCKHEGKHDAKHGDSANIVSADCCKKA